MIVETLRKTTRVTLDASKQRPGILLCGAVASLLSILVVPAVLFLGYALQVRGALAHDDRFPGFDNYGELLADGVVAVLVAAAPTVGLFVWVGVVAGLTPTGSAAGFVGVLLGVATYLYVVPGLMTVCAVSRYRGESVPTLPAVGRFVSTTEYAVGVVAYGLLIVGCVLLYYASALTVVGMFVAAPFVVYLRNTFWGVVYRRALSGADADPVG